MVAWWGLFEQVMDVVHLVEFMCHGHVRAASLSEGRLGRQLGAKNKVFRSGYRVRSSGRYGGGETPLVEARLANRSRLKPR